MKNIRHIILDLGGVILNIDYQKTVHAFAGLGLDNFETHFAKVGQTKVFDDFETGRISTEDFQEEIRKLSGRPLTDQEIEQAWNAMLLDIPLRRLQILQQLQLHFDLFLLSNTNEIHESAFNKIIKEQCGFNTLAVFFDKTYLSHRIGLRKPDASAFQLILEENNLNPAHTLFVDDSEQHIKSAKVLGIQTIWLKPGMSLEADIFKSKFSPP